MSETGVDVQRGPGVSEKVFSGQLVQYLRLMGWRVYHSWISIRSEPGFPDLIAIRPPRLVVIETKSLRGTVTDAQREWLASFAGVPGVETHVLRPTDADWRVIEELFR